MAATQALAANETDVNGTDVNATNETTEVARQKPPEVVDDGEGRLIKGNFCMATTACVEIQPKDRGLDQYYCGIVDGFLYQCYKVDRCDDCNPHVTAKDVGCLTAFAKNKCASVLAENLWFLGYEHNSAVLASVLLALGVWHD
jgi:hypothetical protein